MGVHRFRWLSLLGLAVISACATLGPVSAPVDLVSGSRCTIRVWDRQNPADAGSQVDYWGTIASADNNKIELIDADSEPVNGQSLLANPKDLPLAIWVRRMKLRGKNKYVLRRDQVLTTEILDPNRLRQIMSSYVKGTRVNIRVCDTANPHDPSRFRDVWGEVSRMNDQAIELKSARDSAVVLSEPVGNARLMSDEVREYHLKNVGAETFTIAPERIISIEFLEGRRAQRKANSISWVQDKLF